MAGNTTFCGKREGSIKFKFKLSRAISGLDACFDNIRIGSQWTLTVSGSASVQRSSSILMGVGGIQEQYPQGVLSAVL